MSWRNLFEYSSVSARRERKDRRHAFPLLWPLSIDFGRVCMSCHRRADDGGCVRAAARVWRALGIGGQGPACVDSAAVPLTLQDPARRACPV